VKFRMVNLLLVVSMLFLLVPVVLAADPVPADLAPNEPYKIAFVDCLNTHVFWLTMEEAMKTRASELGVDLTVVAPSKADVTEQTGLVEDLIEKGIDGLILGTCDSKGIIPAVKKANEAGIPVIAVDTAIEGGEIASLIQTDNIKGAEMAAEFIAQDLGGKGKVLVVDGDQAHQTGRDRARVGTYLTEKYPDITVIQQPGNWTQDEAMAVAENVFTANPDVDWVFNACDPMAMGVIQAAQAQGLTDVKIMGFDANPESFEAMKNGTMHAEIAQYPAKMGQKGVEFMVMLLNGDEVPKTYDTGTGLITPESMMEEAMPVPAGDYKIAFVDCLNTHVFWLTMEEAMKARAAEVGVDLTVVAPSKADVTEQTGLVEDLIEKGINGLILGTCDSKGIIPAVKKANEAGIPVIAVDTAIEGGEIASLIQTDNIKGAEMAAEFIAQDLGGKGKVLVVDGDQAHQTGRDRARVGTYLTEKYPDITVIQQPGNWTQDEAMAVAENVFTANPDVDWVFNACDPMAMGVIQAAQAQGLTAVKIMGFDANPESFEAMKNGTMHAEIAQYPAKMGQKGLDFMVMLLNGDEVPKTYDTGTGLITPADVE